MIVGDIMELGTFLTWLVGGYLMFGVLVIFSPLILRLILKVLKNNPKLAEKLDRFSDWLIEVSPNKKQKEAMVMVLIIAFFVYMFVR